MNQIDAYTAEIERLTAERDEWRAKFERLGVAGETYFKQIRSENREIRSVLADVRELLIVYSDKPEAIYRGEIEWRIAQAIGPRADIEG